MHELIAAARQAELHQAAQGALLQGLSRPQPLFGDGFGGGGFGGGGFGCPLPPPPPPPAGCASMAPMACAATAPPAFGAFSAAPSPARGGLPGFDAAGPRGGAWGAPVMRSSVREERMDCLGVEFAAAAAAPPPRSVQAYEAARPPAVPAAGGGAESKGRAAPATDAGRPAVPARVPVEAEGLEEGVDYTRLPGELDKR
jgi:hypothetical protein